jgi:hypothetical protein
MIGVIGTNFWTPRRPEKTYLFLCLVYVFHKQTRKVSIMSKRHIFGLSLVGVFLFVAASVAAGPSGVAQIYFSEDLVEDRISKPIDQTDPVNETIMDTSISGTSHLIGKVSSDLISSDNLGVIRIKLKADTTSQTEGTHWPVVIHDKSKGKIVASIDLLLNGLTFSSDNDHAAADINVTNQNVQSEMGSSRWVLSIAEGKIRAAGPEAKLQADQNAEVRVRKQLQDRVNKLLHEAEGRLHANFIDPLTKAGLKPSSIQFQSTKDWLIMTVDWGKKKTEPSNQIGSIDKSSDLVVIMPEAIFEKVYGTVTDQNFKSVDDMESKLVNVSLPASWHQDGPLKLIKKEKKDGNLIMQWKQID